MSDNDELVGIAAPIGFLSNCDLIKKDNQQVSADTARMSVLITKNGIPLSKIGSLAALLAFEPNDEVTQSVMRYQINKGLVSGSKFIKLLNIERIPRSDGTTQLQITITDSRLSKDTYTFNLVSSDHGWLMTNIPV